MRVVVVVVWHWINFYYQWDQSRYGTSATENSRSYRRYRSIDENETQIRLRVARFSHHSPNTTFQFLFMAIYFYLHVDIAENLGASNNIVCHSAQGRPSFSNIYPQQSRSQRRQHIYIYKHITNSTATTAGATGYNTYRLIEKHSNRAYDGLKKKTRFNNCQRERISCSMCVCVRGQRNNTKMLSADATRAAE